jgi:putative transport protein
LLLSGVVLGRLRQIGPFSAQVPRAARQLVRDLGILLFVAESGLEAGAHLAGVGTDIVWRSVAGGGFVVALSLVVSLFIGRRLLRLPPFEALGSVCGGMTSSAALVVLRRAAGPAEPAVSYAAAYAVASVLVTLAGQLVVRWAG